MNFRVDLITVSHYQSITLILIVNLACTKLDCACIFHHWCNFLFRDIFQSREKIIFKYFHPSYTNDWQTEILRCCFIISLLIWMFLCDKAPVAWLATVYLETGDWVLFIDELCGSYLQYRQLIYRSMLQL